MAYVAQGQRRIPEVYYTVPLKALQPSTRHRISLHLNLLSEISFNDWRKLAELIGLQDLEIRNMQQSSSNPTEAVIIRAISTSCTIGKFIEHLREMERYDIIEDCAKMIDENVNKYKPLQVAEVSSESEAPLTFGELNTGKVEYFDAFISYHVNDFEFIRVLIEKLEKEFGFKLCIPDRDFCVGLVENEATAILIKQRCKRTIVVLSTSYIALPDLKAKLKWQLQVAQSLAPVADTMHKLVPIVIDSVIRIPQDVPEVLIPYNVCDYTRPAIREWFWERMEQSLAAPTKAVSGYKGPSERLGTKRFSRLRTHTEPSNLGYEGEIPETRSQRSESDTSLASISSSVGSTSQFFRPMPSAVDSPKRKKRYPWKKIH